MEENLTYQLNETYFVISGLTLDSEFDYISIEETEMAVQEIEHYIEYQSIQPSFGSTTVHPDDIIYVPSSQTIHIADVLLVEPISNQ